MSKVTALEKRLEAFRKLPLRAQLTFITATRANPTLAQNQAYMQGLERIHAECLQAANPQQKAIYEKSQSNLTLP